MAPGDVAELVRDHALQLVDVVDRLDEAGLDVDRLPGGDEGVDFRVVEQDDADAVGVEPGRLDQRPRNVLEQQFGLAVAEDRRAAFIFLRGRRLPRLGRDEQREHEQPHAAGQQRVHRRPLSIVGPERRMKPSLLRR